MAKYTSKGMAMTVEIATVATAIPQIDSVTIPGMQVGKLEASDHASIEKEFLADLPERGDIELSLKWDPANAVHAFLEESVGDVCDFVLTIKGAAAPTTNDVRTFSGLITNFQPAASPPQGATLMATVTIHPQTVATTDSGV